MQTLRYNLAVIIACALGCATFFASCSGPSETSFFSNFSVRGVVEHSKASTWLNCGANGGGGGGDRAGIWSGGFGFGRKSFNARKSDTCGCRLKSADDLDEPALFAALKFDVEQTLRDAGAQITESGSAGSSNTFVGYTIKNVRGRVELSGTRFGSMYDVRADLNESGN